MKIPLYQVDAFTSRLFSGNPAAVCILDDWIEDRILQSIAAENNLSETAFLVRSDEGYDLTWFTPVAEVALCGHATLASAYVLFDERGWPEENIHFRTRSSGVLIVTRRDHLIEMDFPRKPPAPVETPRELEGALGVAPRQVFGSEEDLLVTLADEREVRSVQPEFAALGRLDFRGIIITARGDHSDFVSRFFAPRYGIPEDPVTGSAHCVLVPYWAGVLGKKELHAFQVSRRGGELFCREEGRRVKIAGSAVLYLEGTITI
jgi:PhzF family phenazine biosynthesis protein